VRVAQPLSNLVEQARGAQRWQGGAGFHRWRLLYIHTVPACQAPSDNDLRSPR
jgi:hypothetical protein